MLMNKICRFAWKQIQRAKLRNREFSIISQNCIGGVIYHNLGLEFSSPMINCLCKGENFVRLCANAERYLSLQPKLCGFDSSPAYPVLHPVLVTETIA